MRFNTPDSKARFETYWIGKFRAESTGSYAMPFNRHTTSKSTCTPN